MPWLPIFVDDSDALAVARWLSDEPEIAFLLADESGRWKAVKAVHQLADGRYVLWQHTGEPLPLLRLAGSDDAIADPWRGWQEQRTGADPTTPYFGPAASSVFLLDLWTRHRPYSPLEQASLAVIDSRWTGNKDLLSLSGFQWIGNRYRKCATVNTPMLAAPEGLGKSVCRET